MKKLHKKSLVELKSANDSTGEFTAIVSVFGNVDYVGDKVMPGAFAKTIQRWREAGDPVPVILSHQTDDIWSHIGTVDPKNMQETPAGLLVKGTLDVDDNPVAAQVHRLMARRSMKEFSFGYSIPKGGSKMVKGVNELHEIDLYELGPTHRGANPATELLSVKSILEEKADEIGPETIKQILETVERLEKKIADDEQQPEDEKPEVPADVVELGHRLTELEIDIHST